jgi:hypothetical protein
MKVRRPFASPIAKTMGEGDHWPESQWWRGRAAFAAPAAAASAVTKAEPEALPLHHPLSGGRSPSPVPLRSTGEARIPFASPIAKTMGEGDHWPESQWWRGRAASTALSTIPLAVRMPSLWPAPSTTRSSAGGPPPPFTPFTGEA